MNRLTNGIDYCAMHCDFGKRGKCFFKDKSKCYEKSMFDKLQVYEEIEEDNHSISSSLAEQIADDLSMVLKEAKDMGCTKVKYFYNIPLENVEIVINALRAYKPEGVQ